MNLLYGLMVVLDCGGKSYSHFPIIATSPCVTILFNHFHCQQQSNRLVYWKGY